MKTTYGTTGVFFMTTMWILFNLASMRGGDHITFSEKPNLVLVFFFFFFLSYQMLALSGVTFMHNNCMATSQLPSGKDKQMSETDGWGRRNQLMRQMYISLILTGILKNTVSFLIGADVPHFPDYRVKISFFQLQKKKVIYMYCL